jgi:hypothetical protein
VFEGASEVERAPPRSVIRVTPSRCLRYWSTRGTSLPVASTCSSEGPLPVTFSPILQTRPQRHELREPPEDGDGCSARTNVTVRPLLRSETRRHEPARTARSVPIPVPARSCGFSTIHGHLRAIGSLNVYIWFAMCGGQTVPSRRATSTTFASIHVPYEPKNRQSHEIDGVADFHPQSCDRCQ